MITNSEKIIAELDKLLPDHLGLQLKIFSLFEKHSESESKEFWEWCFLNGDKVTGHYSLEDRIDKMYHIWESERNVI